MSNFPRFGRSRNRPSVVARPASATGRLPAAELKPEILPLVPVPVPDTAQILEPYSEPNTVVPAPAPAMTSSLMESPRRVPSPVKKAASPIFKVLSPPPVKTATSPSASPKLEVLPVPPPVKVSRSPPVSPANKYSRRTSPPPLSPLALPRTHVTAVNATTTQPRLEAEVEQKVVKKAAKSEKPPQRHQAEAINLSGHNVGAVMEVNQPFAATEKNRTEGENEDKKAMTTFMNTNFQSVNNSVLCDSSCNNRDPGLHLAFPANHPLTVDDPKHYKA